MLQKTSLTALLLILTSCTVTPPKIEIWQATAIFSDNNCLGIELQRNGDAMSGKLFIQIKNELFDFNNSPYYGLHFRKIEPQNIYFSTVSGIDNVSRVIFHLHLFSPLNDKPIKAVLENESYPGPSKPFELLRVK